MTEKQIELGRHALGLPNKQRTSYRNHFVTGIGCSDFDEWMRMVAKGKAFRRTGNVFSGGDDIFWLTKVGATECLKPREKLSAEDFKQ
jgi:hypothetical protein